SGDNRLRCSIADIVQARLQVGISRYRRTENLVADCFRSFVLETVQFQQIAEYAQYLPCRTRIAERFDGTVETLCTTFCIDERAGCFRERRNRQHDIGVISALL